MQSVGQWWMWAGFIVLVLITLAIDLFGLGGKKAHRVSAKEALAWTIVWFTLAFLFNGAIWWYLNQFAGQAVANQKAMEFFTGYLIEKSLSVDNVFVFLLIFNYFAVPPIYQRRILIYGVLGAIAMRAVMILLGSWLVASFHWVLYLFGLFLVITSLKMLLMRNANNDLAKNPLLIWMKKHFRVIPDYHGEKFFIVKEKVRYMTPLFLVLIMIELSDLIFAVDSIPAIFAITTDPFIVFTSNIFAIMGLRALYFLLADMAHRFYLLKYGLALVLLFIGLKMLLAYWIKIPVLLALGVVAGIITTAVLLSMYLPNPNNIKER